MLVMTKSVLAIMCGFILSVFTAIVLIPSLKKLKASQRLNTYLREKHSSKVGTPTMGGLIFIIPVIVTIILLYVRGSISFNHNLVILLFVFLSYALLGFIDDLLIIIKKNNNGISPPTKFLLQILIAGLSFYMFLNNV